MSSHVWAAIMGALAMAFLFVIVPWIGDLRSPERRWSRLKRQQRREIDRLARKGTP